MKTTPFSLPIIAIITSCAIIVCAIGATSNPSTEGFNFARFSKMNRDDFDRTLNRMAVDRSQLEEEIRKELQDESGNRQVKLTAIYMAGLYRINGTCPDLARIITIHYPLGLITHLPPWHQYPAYDALVKIGSPALPSLLHNLATTNDDEVRKFSALALRNILQPELAKCALQQAIDAAKKSGDHAAIERFQKAVPFLDTTAASPAGGGNK